MTRALARTGLLTGILLALTTPVAASNGQELALLGGGIAAATATELPKAEASTDRSVPASFPPPQLPATVRGRDGYYFAREFGAQCDGVTDDTAAIQAAINSACDDALQAAGDWTRYRGRGGVVVFPAGVCRVSDTLRVYVGAVGLQGAGVWSSAVFLDSVGITRDVISFSRNDPPAGKTRSLAGGYGGFVRDLFVGAKTRGTGRHGIHIETWAQFSMTDVWIEGLGGAGLWIGNLVTGTFRGVMVKDAATGVRIGFGSNRDYSTTLSFDSLHVTTTSGPGLDGEQCFGCTFVNGVFEGVGFAAPGCSAHDACPGVRLGRGEWSFYHPYFEGNRAWDVDVAAGAYTGQKPLVSIFNMSARSQPGQKLPGTGGVLVGPGARGGGIYGAWWLDTVPAVKLRSGADSFPLNGLSVPMNEANIVMDGASRKPDEAPPSTRASPLK